MIENDDATVLCFDFQMMQPRFCAIVRRPARAAERSQWNVQQALDDGCITAASRALRQT